MTKFQDKWRTFLSEEQIEEKTRAEKEGVKLPSTAEQLEKYVAKDFKSPEYYMQFSDVNKLGINPKSGYSTPLGIYSYPITKQLYRLFIAGKLPFAQGRKYIIVFKPNEDKNIVLSLGKRNDGGIDSKTFEEMLEKLLSKEVSDGKVNRGVYHAYRRHTQGQGFKADEILKLTNGFIRKDNFINKVYRNKAVSFFARLAADEFLNEKPYGKALSYDKMLDKFMKNNSYAMKDGYFKTGAQNLEKEDFTEEDYNNFIYYLDAQDLSPKESAELRLKELVADKGYNPNSPLEALEATEYWQELKKDARSKTNLGLLWYLSFKLQDGNPRVWRTLFQNVLGIDGVVDVAGEGLIHPSEKIQAVFFSKDVVEQVATIRNTETPEAISRRQEYRTKESIQRRATEFYVDALGIKPSSKMLESALTALKKAQETNAWKIDGANNFDAFVSWLFGKDLFPPSSIPGEFDNASKLTKTVYENTKKESLDQFHAILTEKWIDDYFTGTIGEKHTDARSAAYETTEPLQTQLIMEAQALRREAADFSNQVEDSLKEGEISPKEVRERIVKGLKEYAEAFDVIVKTAQRAEKA